ncbi:MAG: exodeoxyribonuclease VII small subunit [Candidatus Nanopelagicales bacterium]
MNDDIKALLAADPTQMSYEQARDGLTEAVHQLEAGEAPLEVSLALWEQGERFAQRCGEWLDNAEQRLAAASTSGSAEEPTSESDEPTAEPPW